MSSIKTAAQRLHFMHLRAGTVLQSVRVVRSGVGKMMEHSIVFRNSTSFSAINYDSHFYLKSARV